EARNQRKDAERALERPAEERSCQDQVGTGGWLPRINQPRDAGNGSWGSVLCKKGGTAGADAARPFSRKRASGVLRLVFDGSRRVTTVSDSSAAFRAGMSSSKSEPTYLRPVPPAPAPDPEPEEFPTLSLGGVTAPKLKIFTIGSRLKGRSFIEDTD